MNDKIQKVDYAGRTVDLLLLKTLLDVPAVNYRVDLDVAGTPMIVSGVEKLVQRYAIAFLNAMGSTKFMPDHGTRLIPRAGAGLIYSMATLESAAAESNLLAFRQITEADANLDTPDDERLVASNVYDLNIDTGGSRISISVRLTTAAGKSFVYIIPVDVGVH